MIAFEHRRENSLVNIVKTSILFLICSKTGTAAFLKNRF